MIKIVNKISVIFFMAIFLFTPFLFLEKVVILYVVFAIWFFTAILIDQSFFRECSNYFLYIVSFSILTFFLSVSDPTVEFATFIHTSFFTYIWPIFFVFYSSRVKVLSRFLPLIYVLIVISCLFTIYGNIVLPGASRSLASTSADLARVRLQAKSLFVGGYGFVYAIALILSSLAALFRGSKRAKKLVMFFTAFLFVITLITASYFMSIIIGILALILSFSRSDNKFKFLFVALFLIVIIMLFEEPILQGLISIGESIDSEMLVKRAEQLLYGTYQEDYDFGNDFSRTERIINGMSNYLKSPVFGRIFGVPIGTLPSGHSELIGYFEKYGLFGFLYTSFFFSVYKKTRRVYQSRSMMRQYSLTVVLFIVLISLNTFEIANQVGLAVFFLIPFSYLSMEQQSLGNTK